MPLRWKRNPWKNAIVSDWSLKAILSSLVNLGTRAMLVLIMVPLMLC